MNDRFKFRVWHKPSETYITNGNIDIANGVFATQNLLDADKFLIEQCTGFKDRNGNLIYSGDIVKQSLLIDIDNYGGGENTYIDMDIIGVVSITMSRGARINRPRIFITRDPYKDKQEERPSTSRHLVASRCEVIGNIHENKDLLDE